MHRRCKLNPSNAIKCSVDFYFEYLIFNLCNQILVAATCLLVDVCHDMCNPLVQLKEERRQTMVGRHWERNWKEKGNNLTWAFKSFQSSFRKKKKNPKLFTKEKHYIFGIFKSAGNWFDIIRNQILYLKINTEKIHSNRLRNQALYV